MCSSDLVEMLSRVEIAKEVVQPQVVFEHEIDRRFPTLEAREGMLRNWFEACGTKAMSFESDSACFLLARNSGIDPSALKSWTKGHGTLGFQEANRLSDFLAQQSLEA